MADVSVPQKSGEIRISINGDPAVTLTVKNGRTEAEGDILAALLADVPGAKVVESKPAETKTAA